MILNHIIITMLISHQSASTSVYVEQLQNQIDKEIGYSDVRRHLLKQLNQGAEMLPEVIVDMLIKNLGGTLERSEKQARVISIIEDLLAYAHEPITAAFHNKPYIQALINIPLHPKFITFNIGTYYENKLRVCGIFMFWRQKYIQTGQYELFFEAYKELKEKGAKFPDRCGIHVSDQFSKKDEPTQQKGNASSSSSNKDSIVLADIEQFTAETESLLKSSSQSLYTTNYVRLIKHKSKVLYQFTTTPSSLSAAQKNTVKTLYKRLRDVLKQIEKVNFGRAQNKRKEEEKMFMEEKIDGISPKKSQKGSVKKESNSIALTKSQPIDLLSDSVEQQPQIQKRSSVPLDADLLDIAPKSNTTFPIPTAQQQLIEIQKLQQPLFNQFSPETKPIPSTSKPATGELHDDNTGLLHKTQSNISSNRSQSFNNESHSKNQYNFIPAGLNLSQSSSQIQEAPKQANNFFSNLWGNGGKTVSNKEFGQDIEGKLPKYDQYRTPTKKKEIINEEEAKSVGAKRFQAFQIPILGGQNQVGSEKLLKPIDYMQLQYISMASPGSNVSAEEDRKILKTPKKNSQPEQEQQFTAYESSPTKLPESQNP